MERKAILAAFWRAVAAQERDPLRGFFAEGAEVLWPNTNERFSVEEYLRANCEYPGKWNGKIERMLDTAEGSVTVTRVWSEEFSVRAISFFRWQGEKILRLEEYWSDDGAPPEWRRKMQIGQKITEDGNGMKDIFERDMAGEPVSIDENIIAVGRPAGVIKPVPKEKAGLEGKEKTSKRGMPRRAAGPGKGGGRPAGPPGAARRGGRRAPAPAKPGRPAGRSHPPAKTRGEEKPPPAASEKPFDRRGKLR